MYGVTCTFSHWLRTYRAAESLSLSLSLLTLYVFTWGDRVYRCALPRLKRGWFVDRPNRSTGNEEALTSRFTVAAAVGYETNQ